MISFIFTLISCLACTIYPYPEINKKIYTILGISDKNYTSLENLPENFLTLRLPRTLEKYVYIKIK